MERNKIVAASIIVSVIVAAVAWWFGWLGGDREVDAARQVRDELFANRDQMNDTERHAAFEQFRQQMDGLTDTQRRAVFDGGRERFQAERRQRLNEFFAMTPAEQNRELDRAIDEMNERRANRPPRTGNRGGPGGGPGGGRGNRTDAQREERRKSRLDRGDARLRAQRSEYRRRLNDRLAERGMQPSRDRRT
jgi:hypothetical protein